MRSRVTVTFLGCVFFLFGRPETARAQDYDDPEFLRSYKLREQARQERLRTKPTMTQAMEGVAAALDITPDWPEDYARRTLPDLSQRLATRAANLAMTLDAYQRISREHVAALANAPIELRRLAAQFRTHAEEEVYDDRRDDYLFVAEMLESWAVHHGETPSRVPAEHDAVAELYPYVNSTLSYLERLRDMVEDLPVVPDERELPAYREELKAVVASFDELQRELHRLSETNAPAPYPQPAPIAPSPSGPIEFVRDSPAVPSATEERYARRDPGLPTAAVRRPTSPGSSGATPLAWQLAEDRSFRNVLIFHVPGVSGNDALRREVLRVGVTIGQVYSVDVRSGQPISLRVVRSLPSNLAGVQLWLAEPTSSPANAVAELVTFRK